MTGKPDNDTQARPMPGLINKLKNYVNGSLIQPTAIPRK